MQSERLTAAVTTLAEAGVPVDVQELLLKNNALVKALEAALSTDAEPVAWAYHTEVEKGSGVFTNQENGVVWVNDTSWQNADTPLYAEPVKTAPAVAVSREEMAERLFATDWPNDKWDRFKDGDHAKERYLRMADTSLSAQVQDVAGLLDETWNKAVERAAEIANDCVHLTPDPGAAIRTMLNGRTTIPASPASNHGDAE